ncbi:hypothetical protein GUITHDRAFT_50454, partial [Guillardia theta CCMP2712]
QVAAGSEHSCALMQTGDIYTWGRNVDFQLGLGHQHTCSSPQHVKSLRGKKGLMITSGSNHNLAWVLLDGRKAIMAWGNNAHGQCGNGSTDAHNMQQLADSLQKHAVSRLAAGQSHSAVLTGDGILWVCGSSRQGQLGTGDVSSCGYPRPLSCLPPPGVYRVWACGSNRNGVLGAGNDGLSELHASSSFLLTDRRLLLELSFSPLEVASVSSFSPRQVQCGSEHVLLFCAEGFAFAWGSNAAGQLGVTNRI